MSRAKCAAVLRGRSAAATGQTICQQADKDLNSPAENAVYTDKQYRKFNAAAERYESQVAKIIEGG